MAKAAADVIQRAHRRIRVLAGDDAPTAEMNATGRELFDSLTEELSCVAEVTWSDTYVPDDVFVPLSYLLGVELAPEYNKPVPESRDTAWLRVMQILRPDDRDADYSDTTLDY